METEYLLRELEHATNQLASLLQENGELNEWQLTLYQGLLRQIEATTKALNPSGVPCPTCKGTGRKDQGTPPGS